MGFEVLTMVMIHNVVCQHGPSDDGSSRTRPHHL